ncbi:MULTISPECIES: hypothetical protein [Halocynthiibacter]|uniref:Uncharacterized protein n=1 Tax=Halocynthiibacter halioticoli TaxID=2986804 RepID=A0AAE3J178_9RHOB|nr:MULTISPECIES: hypothetical protein [Halocynthiibacter]MCV6825789.1 hypothetical protein [Halocynthiibacter halioticoli]MCW4058790.1 hypothetical protein [Halocynthiibacter sp. SDUM655004]
MKQVFCGFILLLVASPALTEVCGTTHLDLEPNYGITNQFKEMFDFFSSPLGVGLIVLIVVTLRVKRRWLSVFSAALVLFAAVLAAVDWYLLRDEIIHASQKEVSAAPPFATIGLLLLLSIWLFQRGRLRITQRLNTINLSDDYDDVEMLMDIEEAFSIKIEDSEAEKLENMGDLYELVSGKLKPQSDIDPVWLLLCRIARIYSGSKDPINKKTTFFPESAEKRVELSQKTSKFSGQD